MQPQLAHSLAPKVLWENAMRAMRGKKSIHHHRGTSLFSVCRPTPRSQSKKSYGVYHFLGKTRERVYTIGPERRAYYHKASDPEKEKKEGLHGGGVYFFSSLQSGESYEREQP